MNSFECYKEYLAVSRHFKSSYDYFKYNGKVNASRDSLNKRRDKFAFDKLSRFRDPKSVIIGNIILGDGGFIGGFVESYGNDWNKIQTNGLYMFKEDLKMLKGDFKSNFDVELNDFMPYVLYLHQTKKISLLTICILIKVVSAHEKWATLPTYFYFQEDVEKILKTIGFFSVDIDKYKQVIFNHFKH